LRRRTDQLIVSDLRFATLGQSAFHEPAINCIHVKDAISRSQEATLGILRIFLFRKPAKVRADLPPISNLSIAQPVSLLQLLFFTVYVLQLGHGAITVGLLPPPRIRSEE